MLFDIIAILCFYINLDFNRETKADKWLFNFYLPFFMSFIKNPLDAKDSGDSRSFLSNFPIVMIEIFLGDFPFQKQ